MMPKHNKQHFFIRDEYLNEGTGATEMFYDANQVIYGDQRLAEKLFVTRGTIHTWKKKGIINPRKTRGGRHHYYNLRDVLEDLRRHGYPLECELI